MLRSIFNSQTKTPTFAAILLLFSSGISALLGLFRDRLLASRLGAGIEADIYASAFRIPDFVYAILIMGGISAVFLPLFSEYFKKDEKETWEFTNNLLNCFALLLFGLCVLLAIFSPLLINLLVPGFSAEEKNLTVSLTRIMFLSPIFFGLASVFSGVIHYFNRFLVYALAPIFYNIGIILGIIFLFPQFRLYGVIFGVIFGALLYLLIQIPAAINSGYKYQPIFNFKSEGIKRAFKLMIPRTIGATASHFNLMVMTAIASTLSVGSIAVALYYSNNLQQLPVMLVGVSFALASFPALSKSWAGGEKEKFSESFSLTFRQIIFLILPISVLMFLLRNQIVNVVLSVGRFGFIESQLTAASLGIFCFSIFALSLIPLLVRTFYSLKDTKTPVLISIVSIILNIAFSFLFVSLLGGWQNTEAAFLKDFLINVFNIKGVENIGVLGLPLAISLSAIIQIFLLMIFLKRKLSIISLREIFNSFKKVLASSFLMGLGVYLFIKTSYHFLLLDNISGVFWQAFLALLLGVLIYVLSSFFLKSSEMKDIFLSTRKQFTSDLKEKK